MIVSQIDISRMETPSAKVRLYLNEDRVFVSLKISDGRGDTPYSSWPDEGEIKFFMASLDDLDKFIDAICLARNKPDIIDERPPTMSDPVPEALRGFYTRSTGILDPWDWDKE